MTLPPHSDLSSQILLDQTLQKALIYCQNGQIQEAENQYQTILKIQADHPEANYSLGLLALQRNQPLESLPYFEAAVDKRPEHGPYWLAYIDALDQTGQSDIARQIFEMAQHSGLEGEEANALATRLGLRQEIPAERPATSVLPESPQINPANNATPNQEEIDTLLSLYQQGRITDCENLAHSILNRFPNHGFSWKILGALLKQQNRLDEAILAMRQAALLLPQDPEALNNLGLTLKNTGNLAESESILRLALDLNGDFAEAYNNLGVTLMAQGRLTESEECFRQALHIQPEYAEAYCNLGTNLKDQGQFADSESNFQHALRLRPSSAEAYNNLGNLLQGQGRLSEAEANLHKALELKPEFAVAYNNLANTLHCQGHLEDSEFCYRKAMELKPDFTEAYDGLLFVSNYDPDKSADELFELYREYDARFGHPHQNQWKPHTNNRDADRCLKVGYVSPSFYSHPVFHFLEPLLAHHDKSRFEIFAYSETIREDPITTCYKQHVDHWISSIGLSDDELAERIRSDEIDILIDLAGHTGRNRLPVFARKPAPVSLHWLDFGYTTGLSAIDYYLTDIASAPIGSENLFSEQLWRLSTPALAYRPATGMGQVSPLPAVQHGHITFGTLTRAIRINHRTIRVWSEILHQIKGSRLVIDSGSFKDPSAVKILIEKFVAHDIGKDRLDIGYHSPPWDVLRNIDIGLDCFPHNSGTTLFENLYMGVPFITLADKPGIGRLGCSLLEGVGHPEWIARSENEYIEKAIALASDLPGLTAVRAGLREEMQQSPLMDEKGFTERVEGAYRKMFKKWCTKTLLIASQSGNIAKTVNETPPDISEDAIALYNSGVDSQQHNRLNDAKNQYIQTVNIRHDFAEAYNNLGVVFQQEGLLIDAEASFLRALAIKPNYADAYYNLANTYKLQQKFFEAETNYRKVIAILPNYTNAHYYLGNILQEQGRPNEAETCLRQALSLNPNHINAFSTLLFALNYHPAKSSEEIFQVYQEFNAKFYLPLKDSWLPHANNREQYRRLKVGYVAPDYRKHPARYFLEPLLAHHDKRLVETYAYIELSQDDAATDLFHGYVEHWLSTAGLTDDQLSERIRDDAIDILVDLAGHTAGNRLGVFARKPAPVSLHWLDFGYTTGLTAIDYYLTDTPTVPAGSEGFFSETPWRLETPALAYRPPNRTGPVNTLPAQKNGHITFGTLTRAVRINHRTIRVWSEILKRCEGSRLIINSGSFREAAMQEALADQFSVHGIERERLDIGCQNPPWDVLRKIDIGLDCFPHNSGTTLIESLYMGVPYITLADRPSVGRLGSSILEGIGHPEWIAGTEDEYTLKAVALAADLPKLAAIRLRLREDMKKSPLMDEPGFARKVETAYQEMFKRWCDSEQMTAMTIDKKMPSQTIHKQKKHMPKNRNIKGPHPASPSDTEIHRLTRLFDQGLHAEAIELARSLTTRFPHHGFGWKVLGPLLHQQGLHEEAILAMKQAAIYLPHDPDAQYNLGIAQQHSGLLEEAEHSYRLALQLNKNYIQAQYNLGNILKEKGRPAEAESCYRHILRLKPDFFEVHCNLGNILRAQGRFSESVDSYRSALRIRPDSAELYNNLSLTLKEQGLLAEAETACKQALKLNPDFPEAHNNLGLIYHEQKRLTKAEVSYRQALVLTPNYAIALNNLGLNLQEQGRLTESENYYQQALTISPDFNEAYRNRGILYQKLGRLAESENSYRQALALKADDIKTLNNLAVTLYKQGRNSEAETTCRMALELDQNYVTAHNSLGNILINQGQLTEAEKCLRHVLEIKPDYAEARSNLLFVLNYHPDMSGEDIFKEYKIFNTIFGIPWQQEWQPLTNNRIPNRRLKVGYVAPQLRRHSARHFLEPLLAHHDKEKFEVYAYAELFNEDDQTLRYKTFVDHWITTTGMSDAAVAAKIREDDIDILVDLAGHTDGNRLEVFARKPAPVSLHWLDFGYTTGLTAIDYYLTDKATVPKGSEALFSETPWRIETPCLAYRPAEGMGGINPLPAATRGYVTFGTLTRAARINHRTIRVWSEILKQVAGSHLVIDSGDFKDPNLQEALANKFIAHGIERERLEIGFHSPPWDVLRGLDIGFDCFPHNSGTTLFETLYMGVPFITLAGRPSVGRLGCSILEGIGHPEWIAYTEEEYIELAVALAADQQKLKRVRASLREEMEISPLMDGPAFACKVERAYQKMFTIWCKGEHFTSPQWEDKETTEAPVQVDQTLQQAEILYQDGPFQEAEKLYLSILETVPQHAEANYRLGCLSVARQKPSASLPYFAVALEARPEHSPYWLTYIDALDKNGQTESAIQLMKMAVQAGLDGDRMGISRNRLTALPTEPKSKISKKLKRTKAIKKAKSTSQDNTSLTIAEPHPEETKTLVSLFHQGSFAEAETLARSLIERFPKNGFAWKALGTVLKQQGQLDEALSVLQQALQLLQTDAELHNNIGSILDAKGQNNEAETEFRKALGLNPKYVEAYLNLGNTLQKLDRHSESVINYRWALELKADYAEVYCNLGNSLDLLNRHIEAETCYKKAIELKPDFTEAYNNLGMSFEVQGYYIEAEINLKKALQLNPDYAEGYNNLGNIFTSQGLLLESVLCYRRSLELHPYSASVNSNLLFLLNNHPDLRGEEIFEEYKNFNTRFGVPHQIEWKPHTNNRETNRRLKVGYMSPQFRLHSTRHFLEPLLIHHDKTVVETYAYAEMFKKDKITDQYKSYMDHWINTNGLNDADLAKRICTDGIDILVDLAGHTGGNRLGVFARKPAPVSLHWLDFGYTTGLTAIDYYLTDKATVPEGSEDLFSETPWRIETPCLAYRPAEDMGKVSPLPALERGYVTFGTLTRALRINHRTIRVWSEILKHVEGSHLVVNSSNYKDTAIQLALAEKFVAHGIGRERLEIGFHSPPWDVLRGLDIGFDCFPHNSGTTLFETLYMGVPFITLAGRPSVGRLGCSILEGIGHPEWIACTEEEYIELAVALAADQHHLAAVRAGLRQEMEQSPLMDEPVFTHKVEQAYQEMFAKWCESKQSLLSQTDDKKDDKMATASSLQAILNEVEILYRQRQFPEAKDGYQKALAQNPEIPELHYALANTLVELGQLEEAESSYRKALEIKPDFAEALGNLGNTILRQGRILDAETCYQHALEIKPDFAEGYFNLGNLLREQNRLAESQAAYQKALQIKPDYIKAYSNLGVTLQMQGQLAEAENNYRKAIEIQPDFIEGYINLGACLKERGLYREAGKYYKNALTINPDFALCYSNLGSVLKEHGQLSEAERCLRRALELNPDYPEAHSNLLFLLNYHPDRSAEEIYEEYKTFNARFSLPLQTTWQPHANNHKTDRRLKIGYVSPQFRLHSIRHFFEPLLAHHDKQRVEIFAYAENSTEDALTDRYKSYTDHWRVTAGLSNAVLAEKIRADGIDILIDLAGHTANNRLLMFALKPAPVSLHWLDFGYTTGLTAIDYYLTDKATVPEGSEGLFSEKPWRIETPSFAYRPAEGMGDVSLLPALTRGYVTFGTLTRAVRINHRTILVWAEILKQVEGSHLVIDSSNFRDTSMQEELADKFIAHGIDRERLEIGYHSPPWDVLRGLDISLDCFPHNSGTTLFETLYMGVPFITLADRPSVGRLGCSILEGLGHPEWIARTEEEYVQLAVALAVNLPKLATIRSELRQEMQDSQLMNEPAFACRMETAYREMFAKWCEDQQPILLKIEDNGVTAESLLEILHQADTLYQSGQLLEAKAVYHSLLEIEPQHPEANYRLGCIAVALQQPSAALPYFETAIDVRPEHGPYWLAYIDALDKAGQSESARQLLEMAIHSGLNGDEVETLKIRLATLPIESPIENAKKTKPTKAIKKNKSNRQRNAGKNSANPQPDETNSLVSLFQQGNLVEAESAAFSLIERFPRNNLAWKVLGAIRRQQGLFDEALSAMEKAIAIMPKDYICLRNIAVLLCDLGKNAEAESYCRRALAMRPDYADAHNTLSIALRSQKKLSEAEHSCRRALRLKPDCAETFVNLGLILNEENEFAEAEACYRKALELNPNFAEAYCGLSITLQATDRIAEAESACRQALILKPDYAAAYNSLGGILNEQEKYDEAETVYRQALKLKPSSLETLQNLAKTLYNQNKFTESESCCRQVLAIEPNNAEACYNLGNALAGQERHGEAEASYKAALKISPDYPETSINLGNSLRAQGWITEAEKNYRSVLQMHPDNKKAYNNLGNILQEQGRLDESEIIFRSVLESNPDFAGAFGNLLFLLNYHPDKSGEEIYQEYIRFNERFGLPLREEWKPHANSRTTNRRLKVGYVSPQFCQHPVCNFLEPLMANHNKDIVELYAYAESYKEDAATDRYRSYVDHWIPTKGLTDTDMAERIRSDGIDILVDLAGHTGQNRLLVFARKPAPISLHWLDFGYTTGLPAIDYYLADSASVPEGSEGLFAETPWKLATPCLAYRPNQGMGEVNALPAHERGYITFGSLSRAVRINHRTIRVWSEILKQVKGSHLVINSGNFKDSAMQNVLAEKFVAHGIDRDRLEIGCNSPPWDVLRSLDIGFDCFPHNSGTTLFETLYMGIPFITLAGRASVGRLGCSVLKGLGHPEWIANSEEEYIERAVALAVDLPRLTTLRAGLRQEMEQSPLMDEPAFTRKVEAAYKEMFMKWCEEQR